ncbi:MAG: nucleotide exchange factor GrpE [bacterium]|nr:nucleotide exchange factor GrpE [bacterium]
MEENTEKEGGKLREEQTEDQEVEIEETDEEGNPRDLLKRLRERLAACTAEKQTYLEGWQRARAELVNSRKRDEEEKKEFIKFANESLLIELISVLDSFDMAFSHKESYEKADPSWRKGIEQIHNQFVTTLKNNDLEIVEPKGEKFNPSLHEPVELITTDKPEEDGVILEVLQTGYSLKGKLIRPPKVRVGELKT